MSKMFEVGQFVAHPSRPDWGPGKVLEVSAPTATIYWRDVAGEGADGGVKRMRLDHVALQLAAIQTDPFLDNLPPFRDGAFESKPGRRVTLAEAIAEFVQKHPLGFQDPAYIGTAKPPEGERAYKVAAHELFIQTLGGGQLGRLAADDLPEAVSRVVKIAQINLLHMTERSALQEGLQHRDEARRFLMTLSDLLNAPGQEQARLEAFFAAVADLPVTGKTGANKWTVATLLPYLADPQRFMFLKPELTKACADRMRFELRYDPRPNWGTYDKLLEMSNVLLDHLRELGAQDFIDVQSFIWVVGQDER